MKVNAFPYLKEEHTEQQECKERPHTQTVLRKVYHVLEILSLERAVLESEQPVLRGLSCEDGLQHALVARLLVVQLEDEVLSVKPPSAAPSRAQSEENHRSTLLSPWSARLLLSRVSCLASLLSPGRCPDAGFLSELGRYMLRCWKDFQEGGWMWRGETERDWIL